MSVVFYPPPPHTFHYQKENKFIKKNVYARKWKVKELLKIVHFHIDLIPVYRSILITKIQILNYK